MTICSFDTRPHTTKRGDLGALRKTAAVKLMCVIEQVIPEAYKLSHTETI